jgi:hypothetical protein
VCCCARQLVRASGNLTAMLQATVLSGGCGARCAAAPGAAALLRLLALLRAAARGCCVLRPLLRHARALARRATCRRVCVGEGDDVRGALTRGRGAPGCVPQTCLWCGGLGTCLQCRPGACLRPPSHARLSSHMTRRANASRTGQCRGVPGANAVISHRPTLSRTTPPPNTRTTHTRSRHDAAARGAPWRSAAQPAGLPAGPIRPHTP